MGVVNKSDVSEVPSDVAIAAAIDHLQPLLLRDWEVAQLLRVSKTKAYLMMSSHEIPGVVRLGRCLRVHRATLEKWIADRAT